MSTYLYLACLDHDPPLLSHDEVTQHRHRHTDMTDVRRWVAERVELVAAWDVYAYGAQPEPIDFCAYLKPGWDWEAPGAVDHYFRTNAVKFLDQHRACRIGARDECGEWVDVGYGVPDDEPVNQ